MDLKLTDGQEKAKLMVRELMKKPRTRPHIAVLRGVAGTGKTTLIRILAQEVGELMIIAPTGKAALRVKEATGLDAQTIHRWIYAPRQDPLSGQVKFSRKDQEEIHCPSSFLIVVEEASMVGEEVWDDIYAVAKELACHILVVGDPFQLPPVELHIEVKRDVNPFGLLLPNFKFDLESNLTEITRQALESPIIRASMEIRQGDVLTALMELPRVFERNLLEAQIKALDSGGVVLCHKNSSRHKLNTRVREHKKLHDKSISDGEPLLVLRNNYQLHRFNGEVVTFNEWKKLPGRQWEIYDRWNNKVEHASFGHAVVDGEECSIVPSVVFGELDHFNVSAIEQVSKTAIGKVVPYLHANFGYTLTTHKSQGSEWKNVLVVVEKSAQVSTPFGRRWLYTATTRAREHVEICWQPDL